MKYNVGLVLGGGGARGFAHLGIIKALHEKGIFPDVISGVSAGAIAGLFLASGYSPDEIHDLFKSFDAYGHTKIHLPISGLLSLERLKAEINNIISFKDLKDLPVPLYVAVANLNEGKVEYYNEGSIEKLIIASSSIPVLFAPVKINNMSYVDGGVFDNLPVAPLRNLCRKIIAVHVTPFHRTDNLTNLVKIAARTFHLMVNSNIRWSVENCDVLIEPTELSQFEILDVKMADQMFKIGYDFTSKMKFNLE